MHEKEIKLYIEAIETAKNEFYFDAIQIFKQLIDEFMDSELIDDALYNIGLCYFNVNQFEKAIEMFSKVIHHYPDATISILDGGNEFGKTAAKCHYAIMNCYLAMGDIDSAKEILNDLEGYDDTYILVDSGEKKTFKELAVKSIEIYNNN